MHNISFSGISNEEKAHLRQKLLSHFREENSQVLITLSKRLIGCSELHNHFPLSATRLDLYFVAQIATFLAVIISKVARIDYPKDW